MTQGADANGSGRVLHYRTWVGLEQGCMKAREEVTWQTLYSPACALYRALVYAPPPSDLYVAR